MRTHSNAPIRSIVRPIAALVALVAGIVLVLAGLAPPAGAIGPDDTATVTINNVEPGAVVTAHRVIDVHYDFDADRPAQPQYTWSEGAAAWVGANHTAYIGEGNAVTDLYADLTDEQTADTARAGDVAAFADALSAAVARGDVTPAASTDATGGEDGSARLDLPMGGYLIHITDGTYVYRAIMTAITPGLDDDPQAGWKLQPVTIESKRSRPGIDKSVNETTTDHVSGKGAKGTGSDSAGIGETVTFDLRADVPVFPANAVNTAFVIADRLDPGLTLNPDSIAVSVAAGREDATETRLEPSGYGLTTADAKDLDGEPVSFLVDLGGEHYASARGFAVVHVTYTATVNRSAVVGPGGNRNEVRLQYSNNPYADSGHLTEDDDVVVYAYGLSLLKTGSDGQPLSGAEFTLATADGRPLKVVAVDKAQGKYRMPEPGETGGTGATVDVLSVSSETANLGRLTIDGLDRGGYTLVESKAPDGYVLAATSVAFTIADTGATEDGTGELTGSVTGEEENRPGYAFGSVANFKGGLPNTGGAGTMMFAAVGLLLVAGGMILIASRIGRGGADIR